MATWEDGPEYAPALRPDHFAEPSVPPLPVAPPAVPSSPPAPVERPGFDHPYAPVAPLETLIPPVEHQRDPAVPFEVVSAAVTEATSAWGSAHWSPPSGPPLLAAGPDPRAPLGPVTSAPLPSQPFPPPPAPAAGPFPAPGTTEWFQPAPPYPPGASPVRGGPGLIAQTVTIGLIVTLAAGGVVWPLAPIAFGIAFALASRIRVGRKHVLAIFGGGAGLLVVIGIVAALLADGFFADWWDIVARWAQVLCWLTLVAAWIAVWRALKSAPPTVGPRVWG